MFTNEQRQRFWEKVDTSGECWIWIAYTNDWGYGRLTVNNKQLLAHRVSWMIENGPLDPDIKVLHECDTPACVRPDHLFTGTPADNMADMVAKGRSSTRGNPGPRKKATHCQRGHEFTPDNTYVQPSTGRRRCQTCYKEAVKRFWAKQ